MAEFLAIRNWEKRQPGRRGKSEWIKDYTDKDSHEKYEKLSFYQRYVLDALRRLRGLKGENVPNDPMYIARSLHAARTDRPHIHHAVSTLLAHGFLILTNQQVDFVDKEIEVDKEQEKEVTKHLPEAPAGQRKKPKPIRPETSSGLKAVMLLPLNSGEEFAIGEDDFLKWKEFYPAVDVMQELRAMAAWCHSNPTRRKTKSGVKAFVNRWLAKAQNNPKAAQSFREGTNGQPKSEQREKRNDEKYARIEQRIAGIPESLGTALPGGIGGSGNRDVDTRPKLLSLGRSAGSG